MLRRRVDVLLMVLLVQGLGAQVQWQTRNTAPSAGRALLAYDSQPPESHRHSATSTAWCTTRIATA